MAEQTHVRRCMWLPIPDGADHGPQRTRYIVVGITAGEVAGLPAMTLRGAPVQLFGSGIGGAAALGEAAAGEIVVDLDPVPLADVEHAWKAGSDRRVVFVPDGGSGFQPAARRDGRWR